MGIKVAKKTQAISRMQKDVERAHLRLEKQFIESQMELLDQMIDRRSAYFDEVNGQYWMPAGVNLDMDSTVPFFDEESHAYIRRKARWAAHQPYLQNLLLNLRSFVIGSGHKYTVRVRDGFDEKAYHVQCRTFQRWLDALLKKNRWKKRQKEGHWRFHRDGETFIRLFPQDDGYCLFRFVSPSSVTTPTKWKAEPSADYGIKTQEDDVETIDWYFIDEDEVDYYEVQHRKANVDMDVKRGLSTLYCIGENADRARDLLRNMSVVSAMQASIAMIRKHKNASSTAISNFANNTSTFRATHPSTGETIRGKKMRPGSVLDVKDNVDYEFPTIGLNPSAPTAVLGAELRAIASSRSMPEYMVGSDASNANYSSTMEAGTPAVRYFESEQEEVVEADLELIWAAVEYAIQVGKLPPDVVEVCEIDVDAPQIISRNDLEIAQANDIYLRNRTKSPQTTAAELGYDPAKVQADWAVFEDANPDLMQLPLPSET